MKKLIGAEIKSLQNMVSRQIEKFGTDFGKDRPSGPNLFILKFLDMHPDKDIFQKDLEKVLETTNSSCSKVITNMESKGYICRTAVEDARYNKVCLTPLGEKIVREADVYMEDFEKNLRKGLTDEQLDVFFYCIDVMKKNLLSD